MATPVALRKTINANADLAELHTLLLKAMEDEKLLAAYKKDLIGRIQKKMGNAEALKVNGVLRFTWAKTDSYAWGKFAEQYPDLAETYRVQVTKDEIDKDRLLKEHPNLVAPFQTRMFLVK